MYKQPIILFGIVLPLLGLGLLIVGLHFIKSQMTESIAVKTTQYKVFAQSRNAAMETEGKVGKRRPHLARWKEQLSGETISAVRTHLKTIGGTLPSKEFQETDSSRTDTRSGFGAVTAQKSSMIRLGFRGTYRSVQQALLELEARMPQLQLVDLKITPSTQSSLLNFQVTYTAWEN